MARDDPDGVIKDVNDRISNYKRTVHALHAFIGLTIWHDGDFMADTHYGLGRRMDTSPQNQVAAATTVTPDGVIQRSDALGYVAEAKSSLPKDQNAWRDEVLQLRKYDDDLGGWWTTDGTIPHHDLAVLVGAPRAEAFELYARNLAESEQWSFARPLCFIEFSLDTQAAPYVYLRRHHGSVTDPVVAEKLRERPMIPLEGLVVTFSSRKFYDSKPPREYLMETLWQHVFTPMKAEVEYDRPSRCWPLTVAVDGLCTELRSAFGSVGNEDREVAYPHNSWVREALEAFTDIGLARGENDGGYTILFRKITGDIVVKFARDLATAARSSVPLAATQLPLPEA